MLFHVNENGIPEECVSRIGECRVDAIREHAVTADGALERYAARIEQSDTEDERNKIDRIVINSNGSLENIGKRIAARYPGCELYLGGKRNVYVTVDHIEIPKKLRNTRVSKKIMLDLIMIADVQGWALALSPSRTYGTPFQRLNKFYRDYGFVPNIGVNRDTRTTQKMIRSARK